MSYFVTDYAEQLFVGHYIHKSGKYAHASVGACKCINIYYPVNLEVQRYSFNIGKVPR